MRETIQAGFVLAALAATLILPPLAAVWRRTPVGGGWRVPLIALVLGSASQGVLGWFWDRLVQKSIYGEIALYYGLWLGVSLWVLSRPGSRAKEAAPKIYELGLLAAVLVAAIVVRSLHPLGHAALGQSDAYGHLQFIRQVVADGLVHNRVYPPSFAWIMALPVATFKLDPYWLARYGGAFWGTALAYAVFALARFGARPWTRLCAAALVAFCPAWMPLIKTGVGVFANQYGLFLLPVIFWFHLQGGRPAALGLFAASALALAATVPMMLIALLPALLLERLLTAASREPGEWRNTLRIAGVLLPAVAMLAWHAAHIQGIHRDATLEIVTGGTVKSAPAVASDVPEETRSPSRENVRLLQDFCSVKRGGYGNPWLNAAGAGLGLAFLGVGILGLRRKENALRLLGAWGLTTSLQAGTGLFQFSGYQREGWGLLLAAAWLGGWMIAQLMGGSRLRRTVRIGVPVFFAVCLVWAIRHAPAHAPAFSASEDELVETARRVAHRVQRDETELPLTIVVRDFTGFHGNQGDPLAATVGASPRIATVAVGPETTRADVFQPGRQYLVQMDCIPISDDWSPGFFARVQPEQVQGYLAAHRQLFTLNRKIEVWLAELPPERWAQESASTSPGLKAMLIQPVTDGNDE